MNFMVCLLVVSVHFLRYIKRQLLRPYKTNLTPDFMTLSTALRLLVGWTVTRHGMNVRISLRILSGDLPLLKIEDSWKLLDN